MRSGYSRGDRLLALALAIVLVLGMLPVQQTSAASAEFGSVSALTAGTVAGSETAASIVTVTNTTLEWSAADAASGRNQDGWWVGITVKAPEGVDLTKAKYMQQGAGAAMSFPAGNDAVNLWSLVNEASLEAAVAAGNNISYSWQFDWDGNDEYEQTVTLAVVPTGIVLNKDGAQVYPVPLVGYGAVSALTAGTVSGSETEASVVNVSGATLTWSAADAASGRNQDGWWIGFAVKAPAGADLAKVKYMQQGTGAAMSFPAGNDTINLWSLVNEASLDAAIAGGENISNSWQFDWNGDGKYEQTVTLSINPKGITLKQGGVQVYPALGAVSSYTGGTVTGSTEAIVNVLIEEVTLNYTNIGGTDAWWVGIKVEAPASLSDAIVQNAKYQIKNSSASEWSAAKSFWTDKDSTEADALQYIQLWSPLTPEMLEMFKAESSNITTWYQFDWNGDGEYEQNITFSVVPGDKIVLNPVEQAGFGFGADKDVTLTYAENLTYWKEATGALSTGELSYKIIAQNPLQAGKEVAKLEGNNLIILNAGTVTIQVTSAADSVYMEATDTYTLTVEPASLKLTVADASKTYGNADPEFESTLDQTLPENVSYTVSYERAEGEDVGEYTVNAAVTVIQDGAASMNYTCEVIPGKLTVTQRPITVDVNDASKVYGDADPAFEYILEGTLAQNHVIYVSYTRADGVDVGEYSINAFAQVFNGENDCTANYAITFVPGTLTIGQRSITVTVDNASKNYGVEQDPVFTASITEGTLAAGDTIAYELTREEGEPRGAYTIDAKAVVTSGEKDCTANYAITVVPGTMTIGQITNEEFGDQYTLVPEAPNAQGWYDGDVTIVPNEGYSIHSTNVNLNWPLWSKEMVHSTEGSNDAKFFLRRESDGAVSQEFTVRLNVDKTYPDILRVSCDKAALDTIMETLTFGFFQAPVKIMVTANDVTSGVDYIQFSYTGKTGEYSTTELSDTETVKNQSTAVFTLSNNFKGTISVTVVDKAGHSSVQNYFVDAAGRELYGIVLDNSAPEILGGNMAFSAPQHIVSNVDHAYVSYTVGADDMISIPSGDDVTLYYNTNAIVKFTVVEQNFYQENVVVKINGRVTNATVWNQTSEEGQFTGTLAVSGEGEHVVTVEYTDKSTNEMGVYVSQRIVIDTTAPEVSGRSFKFSRPARIVRNADLTDATYAVGSDNMVTIPEGDAVKLYYDAAATVSFSIIEKNFYEGNVVVKVNGIASDAVVWNRISDTDEYVGTLTIDGEGEFTVTVEYVDDSVNNMAPYEAQCIVIDKTAPVIESIVYRNTDVKQVIDGRKYYDAAQTLVITIAEENFRADDVEVLVIDQQNANAGALEFYKELGANRDSWTVDNAGNHVLEVPFDQDANYDIVIKYKDLANRAVESDRHLITVDHALPSIAVTYERAALAVVVEQLTFGFFQAPVTVKVDVADATSGVDYVEFTYDGTSGKYSTTVLQQTMREEDATTALFTLPENFYGSIDVVVFDNSGNSKSQDYLVDNDGNNLNVIVVDSIDPEISDRSSKFSAPVRIISNANDTDVSYEVGSDNTVTISEGQDVTLYYNEAATVYFTIQEENFFAEDVVVKINSFETDAVVWGQPSGDGEVIGTLELENDGAYVVSLSYRDKSNNEMVSYTTQRIVVDSKLPEVDDRSVQFSEPARVVQNAGLTDATYEVGSDNMITVPETDDVILYYNAAATVSFTILEQNFFAEDAVVLVNGVPTDAVVWVESNTGARTTGTLTLEDDGDYVISLEYKDKSDNEMEPYTTQRIVIDSQAPVINSIVIKDSNDNFIIEPKYEVAGCSYYDQDLKLVLTIDEHNFRADDVQILVMGLNVMGEKAQQLSTYVTHTVEGYGDVLVPYMAYGADRDHWTQYDADSWRRSDDTYVLELAFANEANYILLIKYKDLAGNEVTSQLQMFTVDKTAPTDLKVEYIEEKNTFTEIIEKIIDEITFGYYYSRTPVTVTISAQDDISPIFCFDYSYLLHDGVSEVNAELKDQTIEGDGIARDGFVSTAEFTIPAEELTRENQFNGYVTFTATNYAKLVSEEMTDSTNSIIVDNISPVAHITYNNPVAILEDVHYYDGAIQATIQINEANFFAEDVNVTVTKDGEHYPMAVHWVENTVDVHTGSFTLTEDGDYTISVSYTDKSNNTMAQYTSNQLTIDTLAPVVDVTGIAHQSANNAETLSLTVTVTDTNVELANINPVLTAVVKKETGVNTYTFDPVPIDLGEPEETVNEQGEKVFTYTIDNLETDGYYILTCETTDNANHVTTLIRAEDGDGDTVVVDEMNFSVNRNGSVFWVETEHNDKYTGEVYKNQLDNAYVNDTVTIRVHEINVDKVDEDEGKRTVLTLNNGSSSEDIVLVDNVNYEKNVSKGQGGWYENIYTLDNSEFDVDGSYSFNIITYDAANNSNVNTESETGTIKFVVDRTAPVVSANIRNNQRIDAEQYVVEFKISDANLDLSTVVVTFNGEIVTAEDLGGNEFAFVIGDGLNHTVEITAIDKAGNVAELYKIERLTVSTNFLVRWYANPVAFWGTLGGVGGCGLLAILMILFKKKKAN